MSQELKVCLPFRERFMNHVKSLRGLPLGARDERRPDFYFACPLRTEIVAAAEGVVMDDLPLGIQAALDVFHPEYQRNPLFIEGGDFSVLYLHACLLVEPGTSVSMGEPIGEATFAAPFTEQHVHVYLFKENKGIYRLSEERYLQLPPSKIL